MIALSPPLHFANLYINFSMPYLTPMKAKSPSYLVELLVQGSAWHVSLVTASTTIPRLRIISGM